MSLPSSTAAARHSSLPIELTTFVGRRRELRDLGELLRRSRLVTLTGAGGSGKTRLALALVEARRETDPDEAVVWVELAPVEDPALVPDAVTEALGASEALRAPDATSIARILGDAPTLLVLDNCEHVVDRCAELVDALLRAAPALRVLATSREPLAVSGERSWFVPALTVPTADTLEQVLGSDAVELFVERAREVSPDFAVTVENASAVADICRRLDGIPLAIELAAARVRLLTPEQIRARLDGAFQILQSTSRTSIPRHRTLHAAIDWSHDLLPDDARALLRRLSVFRGGATLDAVEAVGLGRPDPGGMLLETLARLVDRSLVSVAEHQGAARYRLLEIVRQYAATKLEASGETDDAHRRHADHFLTLAQEASLHLRRRERPHWVHRLTPDLDNFREALSWTRSHEPRAHVRLVSALHWLWYSTGHWTEANHWSAAALALPEAAEPGRDRAALLFAAGATLSLQGRPVESRVHLQECVELAAAAGDESLEAYALTYLGMAFGQVGSQDAVGPCRRAAALFDAQGDDYGHRLCRLLLGTVAALRGDMEEALAENQEGVRLARRFGMLRELGVSLQNTALTHIHRHELDAAEAYVRESIEHFRSDPSHFFMAVSLDYLGEILGRRGRLTDAARLFGAGEALREIVGAVRFPVNERRISAQIPAFEAAAGREAWEAAWREGRALAPDAIVEAVPELPADATPPPHDTTEAGPEGVAPPGALRSEAPMPSLAVRALGSFEVEVDGEPFAPDRWSWAKPREALVYLLLHPDGAPRDRMGSALWPDAPPSRVKNSFHVTLHHLRKSLGHPEWIVLEGDRYRIAAEVACWLDASAFEDAIRAAEDAPPLERALALWRGPLLEGEGVGPWIEPHRERSAQVLADARMRLAALYMVQGRTRDAAALYHAVVLADELREDAHRQLMAAWAELGQRPRALRHYEALATLLHSELQAAPEPETVSLYESLRTAEAS